MNEIKDYRELLSSLIAPKNDTSVTDTGVIFRSFFIRTYGCQMNERDSEKMAGLLTQMGFSNAASQDEADIIIYNTCCVRESAEEKIIGNLSYLKKLKTEKKFILAVGGCMTQQKEMCELLKNKHKYVDIIFGTGNRHRLAEFIFRAINGERVADISEENEFPEITDIPVTAREFSHKSGVNIMYGCDNFCSYCIVPYVRGREKSRPVSDILDEIKILADDGIKEIMLLGQNVNSYSGDANFPKLLKLINEINGIERIRFMTSHPKDFSDELISAMRDLSKVCKHVHLPLQSGSTRVLADMNRHYTKDEYISLALRLQKEIPGISITTDIIVGYPGETEEDFEDTLDVVRRVEFFSAFTFIYSKRSGTPAAERTDLIPRKTTNERFDRLTAELYPIMTKKNEAKIGRVCDAMVDEVVSPHTYKARTDDHTLVHFTSEKIFSAGEIAKVRIDNAKTFYVSGTEAAISTSS